MEHLDKDNPLSLVIGDITATNQYMANHIAHQLTPECKLKIKEGRRVLINDAIQKFIEGRLNWEITVKDFRRIFNFPLDFKPTVSSDYLEDLRIELGLSSGNLIKLEDIWSSFSFLSLHGCPPIGPMGSNKLDVLKNKLTILNGKIFNNYGIGLMNYYKERRARGESHEEAIRYAYIRLLKGTKVYSNYWRAVKMVKVLSTVINKRLVSSNEFGQIVDPYSWTKIQCLFNIDMDYPDNSFDWMFNFPYIPDW